MYPTEVVLVFFLRSVFPGLSVLLLFAVDISA